MMQHGRPVAVALQLVGKKFGDYSYAAPLGYADPIQFPPYIAKDCKLSLVPTKAGIEEGWNLRSASISLDCHVQDPRDGMRENGSKAPLSLYNLGSISCGGKMTRDPQVSGANMYLAFLNSQEYAFAGSYGWSQNTFDGQLTATMARGGAACSLYLPRIRYTSWVADIPPSRRAQIWEDMDFVGLGDIIVGPGNTVVTTPAVTLSPLS
jgi:hypothetical protein